MADKSAFPPGTHAEDFACFGPAATKDGEFDGMMMADMGCFNQDGTDSNKYYHASVCQHRSTGDWYTYYEWARTGAKTPQYQFFKWSSKEEAIREFIKQCHSKNDKRGEWVMIGTVKTLRAKKDKDCYLVRPQAKRSTGLPDARTIVQNEGAKPVAKAPTSSRKAVDEETMLLMRDCNMGNVSYVRSSMADSALPMQNAIDDGYVFIGEAKKRLKHLGDDIKVQVADKDLRDLTAQLYGRIPKIKPLRLPPEKWILSGDNIRAWEDDLAAYESALSAADATDATAYDPFAGLDVTMEFLPPNSKVGAFIRELAPKMTNGRNGYGAMKVHNVWRVDHFKAEEKFQANLKETGEVKTRERALFQPPERPDMPPDNYKYYHSRNCAMMVHGSRSVNVGGILKGRLRLPKTLVGVAVTGAMFGDGIYFADDWQKSAHYTSLPEARWTQGGGSVVGRHAFIFLSDVTLGSVHIAPESYGFTSAPKGYHSVMGKGEFTVSRYRGSGGNKLVNNEFIVYTAYQNQLRYLIEFSCGRRW